MLSVTLVCTILAYLVLFTDLYVLIIKVLTALGLLSLGSLTLLIAVSLVSHPPPPSTEDVIRELSEHEKEPSEE
jgi:hypothetical protein